MVCLQGPKGLLAMVFVPVVDVVRVTVFHFMAFVGDFYIAAEVFAEIEDMHRGVRLIVFTRQSRIEAKDVCGFDDEGGLFEKFPDDGLFGSLADLGPAGGESPEVIVGAVFEEEEAFFIEQSALNADLGGDVTQFLCKAFFYRLRWQAG